MTDPIAEVVTETTESVVADPRPIADPTEPVDADPGRGVGEAGPDAEDAPIELTEAALEALLFVAERPLGRREIAAIAGTDRETVDARLGDLEVSLQGRGIRLVHSGDRVELATAPEAGRLVGRYVGAGASRLSTAALETLAIVAYRQPVTKSAVERIRGVDSDYTIRALLHRRLVVELGRSEAPGRPYLYGTDFEFLERFGIASLEELPPLDAEIAARMLEAAAEAERAAESGAGTGAGGSGAGAGAAATRDAAPDRVAVGPGPAGPDPER